MADPEPYYQDELVTLYCGDALEVEDWLAAALLATDPPYGIDYRSGWGPSPYERMVGDQDSRLRDRILTMWGTSKPAAVFGSPKIPRPEGARCLIWDKSDAIGPGRGDLAAAFGISHEEIYLLGDWPRQRGQPRRSSVLRSHRGLGGRYGLSAQFAHPTVKPVALMTELIEAAPPGIIADPFSGTGSTLVAAKMLGRRAIGVEIAERYCEIAAQRLSQLPLPLAGVGA